MRSSEVVIRLAQCQGNSICKYSGFESEGFGGDGEAEIDSTTLIQLASDHAMTASFLESLACRATLPPPLSH